MNYLTDEQVEQEIERLRNSPYVALARKEQYVRCQRRQALYSLRHLEKKGKSLAASGITMDMLDAKRISPATKEGRGIALEDSVYYLCGVAQPFKWEKNFHLAFMPQPGSTIHYESNGITVEIEGAVQLPICTDNIDQSHPKARLKSYHTCRNWQFANWFQTHLKNV